MNIGILIMSLTPAFETTVGICALISDLKINTKTIAANNIDQSIDSLFFAIHDRSFQAMNLRHKLSLKLKKLNNVRGHQTKISVHKIDEKINYIKNILIRDIEYKYWCSIDEKMELSNEKNICKEEILKK